MPKQWDQKEGAEALKSLLSHPGWEWVRMLVLQDRLDPQGEVLYKSILSRRQADLERELRSDSLVNAKYCHGRIDELRNFVKGELITQLLNELTKAKE